MSIEVQQECAAPFVADPVSVLVVEDETLIRLLAADILRDAGFDVLTASHAGEAVGVLKDGPKVDFLFTDIMMPGVMNGIGLASWVRAHHPGVAVAFCSGVLRSKLDALGMKEGEVFFPKPVDFDKLVDHIKATIANLRLVAPAGA